MAELHDMEVEQYLKDCVDIDDQDIDGEYIRIAPDLAYWNHQFADAVQELAHAKFNREQTHARRYAGVREELMQAAREAYDVAAEGATDAEKKKLRIKAPTVDDIKAAAESDDEYAAAKLREIEAEGAKARMYGVVDAVRTKRDMLVQMGADRRVEMQGDPIMRDQARQRREVT